MSCHIVKTVIDGRLDRPAKKKDNCREKMDKFWGNMVTSAWPTSIYWPRTNAVKGLPTGGWVQCPDPIAKHCTTAASQYAFKPCDLSCGQMDCELHDVQPITTGTQTAFMSSKTANHL